MANATELYERDFVLWSEEQAAALRAAALSGTNLPLDWENLAEEIDSLGKSLHRELRSRIATIIAHLLRLQYSSSLDPRQGWIETVVRERSEIDDLLNDNPSLLPALPEAVLRVHAKSCKLALVALAGFGEVPPSARAAIAHQRYSPDQVLRDWLPELAWADKAKIEST